MTREHSVPEKHSGLLRQTARAAGWTLRPGRGNPGCMSSSVAPTAKTSR